MAADKPGESGLTHVEGYEIWGLLRLVSDGLLKARDNELRPLGTSTIQVATLYVLRIMHGREIRPTPSEIARWLAREPSSITSLLDRMEQQGLVRLVRSSSGKREVLVETTEKGKEVYRREAQKTQAIHRVLGVLSTKEREELKTILRTLSQRLMEELAEKLPY
ncbi:MAG: MarR family transcriptional regulator [Chloroflexi bacterium]|nr:MarR family transcriptional regulator [Chloroflexota bacterium]